MKSRNSTVLLFAALIVSNFCWALIILNSGITTTYQESSLEMASKMYEQTIRLANLKLIGLNANEAIELINLDVYGLKPFEKENCIYAGGVCVHINDERIVVGIK